MRRCILLFLLFAAPLLSAKELDNFNRALSSATKAMSNAGILALWEDEGVSLLPATAPIAGKKAIAAFLDEVTKHLAGAKMESFAMECHDEQVAGDWASQWCTEHQIVRLANGSKFDGRGKMLFVLHRGKDGKWRIREEMWNQAPAAEK